MNGFGIRSKATYNFEKSNIYFKNSIRVPIFFPNSVQTVSFFLFLLYIYIFPPKPCDFGTLLVSRITCIFDIYIYENVKVISRNIV